MVFCSKSIFLVSEWVPGYSPPSLLSGLMYLIFYWGLWSIWSWILCRTVNVDLFVFFYMKTSSLTITIYRRCYIFPRMYPWFLHQKWGFTGVWIYVWAFSLTPFISIPLFVPVPHCGSSIVHILPAWLLANQRLFKT